MKKLKFLFRNTLIRNKIIIIYIPLIVLPLFFLGWISNYIFTQEIIKKTFINVQDDSSLIRTRLNGLIANAESCANTIVKDMNNNDMKILLESRNINEAYAYEKRRKIIYILSYAMVIFPEVESAAFIDDQNQLYFTSKKNNDTFNIHVYTDTLEKIHHSNGINIWFPMHSKTAQALETEAVLTLGKKVLDIDRGNALGSLILNINESSISSIYSHLSISKGGKYHLADSSAQVISSEDKIDLFTYNNEILATLIHYNKTGTQKTKSIDGEEYLITLTPIESMDWILINQTGLLSLTSETRKLSLITFWIGLVCVIIALIGGSILSKFIAGPIVMLTSNMKQVKEGNLDIHFAVNSNDEIGLLASGFNAMFDRLKTLMINIKEEQKKKREFELALIQAQIKPHFLYNALDLIYIFSSMGRNKEAQTTTKNLADFYRIALSQGKEIITVGEELRNVENYLSIQRVRYSDIFEYEILSDEKVIHFDIPKLTIQPLVENAIYHGLKLKGSFGKLKIEACQVLDTIVIKITDDGAGMSLDRLNKCLSKQTSGGSFGLTSVNERIKLYFGEEYGLTLNSIEGEWTCAKIHIPKRKEGRPIDV